MKKLKGLAGILLSTLTLNSACGDINDPLSYKTNKEILENHAPEITRFTARPYHGEYPPKNGTYNPKNETYTIQSKDIIPYSEDNTDEEDNLDNDGLPFKKIMGYEFDPGQILQIIMVAKDIDGDKLKMGIHIGGAYPLGETEGTYILGFFDGRIHTGHYDIEGTVTDGISTTKKILPITIGNY